MGDLNSNGQNDAAVKNVLAQWKDKKNNYLAAWRALDERNGNGGWPAKLVSIDFMYQGARYSITPEMIDLNPSDPWDQGFLEYLTKYIKEDLLAIGAVDIYSTGFLD